MKPAIRVDHLSKRYVLGGREEQPYRTLRESLVNTVRGLRRTRIGDRPDEFWALRDVTFDVQPGEVIGLIGRNGAGKSTLLKILSKITEPTAGRAELRGRVGSLLEVGTGFHNELTGRENIYLSGSILGMGRKEIDRKFDEIVAFAEVDRFLDTPVKRYSSGMFVRLAFAVAAHLEPEILIVDEVLAVGDASYQRKCIDRMRDLARGGRTILFVSHNMDLVPRLCMRAVLLERGHVKAHGNAQPIVARYLAGLVDPSDRGGLSARHRSGDGRARFTCVRVQPPAGRTDAVHRSGDDLTLRLDIRATQSVPDVALAVNLRTLSGTKVHSAWTTEQNFPVRLVPGDQSFECTFRRVRFRPGFTMEVELWMASAGVMDHVLDAARIPVVDGDDTAEFSNSLDQGVVLTTVSWRTSVQPQSEFKVGPV